MPNQAFFCTFQRSKAKLVSWVSGCRYRLAIICSMCLTSFLKELGTAAAHQCGCWAKSGSFSNVSFSQAAGLRPLSFGGPEQALDCSCANAGRFRTYEQPVFLSQWPQDGWCFQLGYYQSVNGRYPRSGLRKTNVSMCSRGLWQGLHHWRS